MLKKWVLTLGFVFLTISVMGASCGGGPAAKLANISDTSLSLTAQAGAGASGSFTFENTGDATLTYTITETLGFLTITQGASGTVEVGDTATVGLEVTCTTEGTLNGTIAVESNGGDVEVDVEVICTTPTAQLGNLSDTSLSLTAQVGSSTTESFTFDNTGQANLTYTTSVNGAFLEVTQGASDTVTPGDTATVGLEATCTTQGTFNGNVSVDSNGGDATVAVTLTCTPPVVSNYDVEIRFVGSGFSQERRDVFNDAAARWSEIIVGELPDFPLNKPANDCLLNEPAVNETIDDLLIHAIIVPIDGVGGILASAGPCYLRVDESSNLLPFTSYGVMRFDEADVEILEDDGEFDEVILHEMGHVLGIGSLWDFFEFLDYTTDPAGNDCRTTISSGAVDFVELPTFNGSLAVTEFNDALGGIGQPLVEDLEQPGTGCAHWDEAFFDNELMTGFINRETPGPLKLSKLTVVSLADLGYEVNLGASDIYEIPGCSPTCGSLRTSATSEAWEVVLQPKGAVKPNGEIILFNDPR